MIELAFNNILFNEEEHKYFSIEDGKDYVGITGIDLLEQLFPMELTPDHPNWHYVVEAGERGSKIHHNIQAMNEGKEYDNNIFISEYHRLMPSRFSFLASEYTVTDRIKFSSNIDNVWTSGEKSVALVDFKTWKIKTDKNLKKAWYQLNFYKTFFEICNPGIEVTDLFVMWLPSDMDTTNKDGELISVSMINEDAIQGLLHKAYEKQPIQPLDTPLEYVIYTEQENALTVYLGSCVEQQQQIADFLRLEQTIKSKRKEFEDNLRRLMSENGVKKVQNRFFNISLSDEITSQRFDSAAFKKDYPDLYEKYCKESVGAPRLTIKLSK